MKLVTPVYVIIFLVILFSCKDISSKKEEQVVVFCAAGLSDLVTELNDSFELKYDAEIKLNLASSGTLARQIAQGYSTDIFISASKQWADYAFTLGIFSDQKELCYSKLVFVSPPGVPVPQIDYNSDHIPDFNGYLSLGDPEHVPAGMYTKEALQNLNWWNSLESRILPAKDVRSALMPLELGECELGILYLSTALASEKVKIVSRVPDSLHTPIVFYALLSHEAPEMAGKFFTLLSDTSLRKVWFKYGLTPATQN